MPVKVACNGELRHCDSRYSSTIRWNLSSSVTFAAKKYPPTKRKRMNGISARDLRISPPLKTAKMHHIHSLTITQVASQRHCGFPYVIIRKSSDNFPQRNHNEFNLNY